MIRSMLLLTPLSIVLSIYGCSFQEQEYAALEVRADPDATVFFDNEHMGRTPLIQRELPPGAHTVRLVTNDQEWTTRIELTAGITTMVNYVFGPDDTRAAGETASFTPGEGMIITSVPDGAMVSVDDTLVGPTPVSIPGIEVGAHTVRLEKTGFESRSILGIKVVDGYATRVHMLLPQEGLGKPVALPQEIGTDSAVLGQRQNQQQVVIQPTETGWLRVRSSPGGPEVTKVNIGETYPFLAEEGNWVQIELDDGSTGWVSRAYVEMTHAE